MITKYQLNFNRKDYLLQLILLSLAGLLLTMTYIKAGIFGSSCDWYSQHITLAETMRQTFYDQHTLFPTQLPLGGGMNIYDFAYYGYLRPDVLIGCALPFLTMQTVITAYMMTGYLISVLLCYRLMRRLSIKIPYCFLGTVIFLSAGCFFHLHRQIMFINYMPYLLGAFTACIKYHRNGRKAPLIAMLFLIELHSFYYSMSCLLAVYLFLLYTSGKGHDFTKLFRLTRDYCLAALCSVLMAALLLLPAAASILSCAAGKDAGAGNVNPLNLQLDLSSLLYNPYGLGLTLSCLLLLLLSLFIRRMRLLGGFLLFSCLIGIIPFLLNGFLYARAKILIPFLPLVIILIMQVLQFFWCRRQRPFGIVLFPLLLAAYMQYRQEKILWVLADIVLVLIVYTALYLRSRSKSLPLLPLVAMISSLTFCYASVMHRQDNFVSAADIPESSFTQEELKDFYADSSYRFDSFVSSYQTGNRLLLDNAGRSSMYTSTSNQLYSSFYFDIIKNPIRINNRQALLSVENPFFQYLMGVRYLESSADALPVGYQIRQQAQHSVLAENENVLPVCYGSTELLSEAAFDCLEFPANLEALVNASIVPDTTGSKGFPQPSASFSSHIKELDAKADRDYMVEQNSANTYTITPTREIKHQILILTFKVERTGPEAVTITIDGIRNKLSGSAAPYPNNNSTFTYILSSSEAMDRFTITTEGRFHISDVCIYSLSLDHFGLDTIYAFNAGETNKSQMLNGSITMPEDGYLITSYPIQNGYTAIVDGVLSEIKTVNKAFVGIPLKAGTHRIQILYQPPLRTVAAILSLMGSIIYAILIHLERKRSISL